MSLPPRQQMWILLWHDSIFVKKYEQTYFILFHNFIISEHRKDFYPNQSVEVSTMMNEKNSKVKDKAAMCQGDWMIKCGGQRDFCQWTWM